jgi:hypothetical protein
MDSGKSYDLLNLIGPILPSWVRGCYPVFLSVLRRFPTIGQQSTFLWNRRIRIVMARTSENFNHPDKAFDGYLESGCEGEGDLYMTFVVL